jgi:7-cyano-7-deazaguanine synthase in queuosine biosynthesis
MLAKIEVMQVALIEEQVRYHPTLTPFLDHWLKAVTELNPKRPLVLKAPYLGITKADVIRRGTELKVDLRRTWSCYGPGPLHCGDCEGCLGRKVGFTESGIADPTGYAQ